VPEHHHVHVSDEFSVTDEAKPVLLHLGPVTVRPSARMAVTIGQAVETDEAGAIVRAPAGNAEASAPSPTVSKTYPVPQVDIETTHVLWLFGSVGFAGWFGSLFGTAGAVIGGVLGYVWGENWWRRKGAK
jgi:hypothetical protein